MMMQRIIYAFSSKLVRIISNDTYLVAVGVERRQTLEEKIKVYNVANYELIQSLPLAKDVRQIKFFKVLKQHGVATASLH
jgi:hypothetical protein